MALVRKLPMKKMGLHTFGELADSLSNSILATDYASTRVDIIFDVYNKSSIKLMERAQRSSSEQITITIRSDNQKLPVGCKSMSSSGCCRMSSQTRRSSLWSIWGWMQETVSWHWNTDHRALKQPRRSRRQNHFHINDHVVKHGVQSVLVDSPNTDVFVNLIFHFNKTWQLQKLYMKLGNQKTKKTVPVHLLVDQLDNGSVSCLPAIHVLSGCDSTSKVGPKVSGLKTSTDLFLLEGFGVEEL